MTLCIPPGADWSCAYSEEQLTEMRADDETLAKMDRSEALAWIALARLTGDRIGVCPVTVRPCAATCGPEGTWTQADASGSFLPGGNYFSPYVNRQGAWVNGCGCGGDCGCGSLSEVILPGPVGRVEDVWLYGEVVSPSRYRIDNGNRLVSTDPTLVWPSCQNLMQDAQGDEAFAVRYYRGSAPNELTLWAAGLLAVEFFKACQGDSKCRLPQGIQTITRQGITYEIQTDMFSEGKTGIREVDTLVASLNPYNLRQRPVIASPDTRTPRMTTVARRV